MALYLVNVQQNDQIPNKTVVLYEMNLNGTLNLKNGAAFCLMDGRDCVRCFFL